MKQATSIQKAQLEYEFAQIFLLCQINCKETDETTTHNTEKRNKMYRSDPEMAYTQVFLLGAYFYAITLLIAIQIMTY